MFLYQSYINNAKHILETYKGEEPFANHAKKYFKLKKHFGSRDRRYINSFCYAFFRMGNTNLPINSENLLKSFFLTEQYFNELIHYLKPEWDDWIEKSVEEKINFLNFPVNKIFEFKSELSKGVNHLNLCLSYLQQPKLFIRVRPHKVKVVIDKLQKAKIPLAQLSDQCIALANGTKLDDLLVADKQIVIQDYNSQKVFNYLKISGFNQKKAPTIWDCCTASGGKSILLYDIFKFNIKLTVSDIRLSILFNLHQRFNKAELKDYNYFVGDIGAPNFKIPELTYKGLHKKKPTNVFEIIVCDVPCTGSGTWSRTPENLCYFKKETIKQYAKRQQQIVSNAAAFLETGGLFFYITCSIFKQENEDISEFIQKNCQLQLLHQEVLIGYDKKADNMFVAVFTK